MKFPQGLVVLILLGITAVLAFFGMLGDSTTFDEMAHIPAGYSYLTQKDMRLNPEHPPLIKDSAALPLLFLNLDFPGDDPSFNPEKRQWWHQFQFAEQFLYNSGNNPDLILFWARLPMISILIFFGWFLWQVTRKLFGGKTAILVLALYAFSPTFLAHGRLVTTDVPAAAAGFIATYYFINWLKNPSWKNLLFAGLTFGLAELTKFSLILLIPIFGLILVVWTIIKSTNFKFFLKSLISSAASFILIVLVGLILIGVIYQYHVFNYPTEILVQDIKNQLHGPEFISETLVKIAKIPILKAYAGYLLGLTMVFQRVTGGNTVYFMGEVSSLAWRSYFPIVYAIKEPLAFHLLTILALIFWSSKIKEPFWRRPVLRLASWIGGHLVEFSFLVFIAIYWVVSIMGNLNLGVRHLLPTFPFIYILVANKIVEFSGQKRFSFQKILVFGLLFFYIISSLSVYPYFITYFNELAGGPKGGYRYVVDSNLDWGQDLKRLAKFVKENNIKNIKVSYFGGGKAQYYLGEKFEELPWGKPQKGWLAVSASFLQGGSALPRKGFEQPTDHFLWLSQYKPKAVIGNSIFVYYIP